MPFVVLATLAGSAPAVHAADRPELSLERDRIEAALRHLTLAIPGETAALLRPEVQSGGPLDVSHGQQAFRFAIAPGPLPQALAEFSRITGLKVEASPEIVRNLTSDGVSGEMTAAQALERLLKGTALAHSFKDAATVMVEIRVDAAPVDVTGSVNRIPSPKYSAPLAETPQTIQVIPRTLIDEQGATTLSEALRNVPGITLQAGEGGGASNTTGDMFNMRGFSASNSLFVDGVRDDGLVSRDVFNLEQIEVFSGPTGADVGRTNAAGYVNMTTKSPTLSRLDAGTFSYGSGDQVRITADLNERLPLGEGGTFFGNSAVRLNALWQDGGLAGRAYVDRESRALAPAIAFGLETPTRVSLEAQFMRQDNLPDYGLPAAASPVGQLTSAAVLAPTPVDQDTYYGSPDVDYDKVSQDSVTARIEHEFRPSLTLRNQTRYSVAERTAVITSLGNVAAYNPATNLVSLSRQANERKNDIFSNQTSVMARAATGTIRHDLSLGLEISRESQAAPALTGVGTRAPVDVNDPDVFSPVVGMSIVPSGATSEGNTETVALYLFDGFDAGPRVRLSGGIRVEHYSTRSHAVAAPPASTVTDVSGDGTLLSGKAGLVYRLNAAGNVYVSYASSQTPPGSANFQLNTNPANQNNPNVDPQTSTNYEVGSKWNLAQSKLQLTGAFFRTRNTNVIFVVDATAAPPIFNQDDGQLVRGVSFSAIGQLTPRWDITLNAQYLDARLDSQNAANDGKRLILTPEFAGSLWTTVRLAHDIRVGGGLRYTDPVFINAANTIQVPRYAVADAVVMVPVTTHLDLRLNLYNLTDNVYIRSINNNGGRYNPGTPRSFLVSTSVRF